jgi:hypothetical protein
VEAIARDMRSDFSIFIFLLLWVLKKPSLLAVRREGS